MDLRKNFLEYFKSNGHLILPSSSLVPENDPSVLLTTAGMQQFKPYYLGIKSPPERRIATVQKCFRTSDIDNVGYSKRHLTFFEMLGNFSFDDYFKEEAIKFSLDFIINHLDIPMEKLWAAVFKGEGKLPKDEEAAEIWKNSGIPEERICEFGKSENFWGPAGSTGPCGPCTEIYYDFGKEHGCGKKDCGPSCDCDRFLEIWNLVFTQYDFNGKDYLELPTKNIDTGMGLERIAAVLERDPSVFRTFLFKDILKKINKLAGNKGKTDSEIARAKRIIADHIRSIYFLIADGIIPSNEGRGYILRRIIRRAIRYGKLLGVEGQFLNEVGKEVIKNYSHYYKELKEKEEFAFKLVNDEEKRFSKTLKEGSKVLLDNIKDLKADGKEYIKTGDAFKLYDTFGFPIELTQEILNEHNLKVDLEEFENYLEEHSKKSKTEKAFDKKIDQKINIYSSLSQIINTEFIGYQNLQVNTEVLKIFKYDKKENLTPVETLEENNKGEIILKSTPFYGEKGGQIGDTGAISVNGSKFEVTDTQIPVDGIYIHKGKLKKGKIKVGDKIKASVDIKSRKDVSKNHTATHLLHWALRNVLGQEVKQSGSFVSPGRLRFDYTTYQTPKKEDLERIEKLVNEKIQANDTVRCFETTREYAQEIGAISLFEEKYGKFVRVIEVNNYSRELCGGTHVRRTGELGIFKILSDTSIGANIRRIEACTGMHAYDFFDDKIKKIEKIKNILNAGEDNLIKTIKELNENLGKLQQDLQNIRINSARDEILEKYNYSKSADEGKIIYHDFSKSDYGDSIDSKYMGIIGDEIRDIYKQKNTFIVFGNIINGKPVLILQATKDLLKKGIHCGKLAKDAGKLLKGGGGGKPDFAQSGGSESSKLGDAIAIIREKVKEIL